jgi:hypothetical protein
MKLSKQWTTLESTEKKPKPTSKTTIALWVSCFVLTALLGTALIRKVFSGKELPDPETDSGYIVLFVKELADKTGNSRLWANCFARSVAPGERELTRFAKYSFASEPRPTVNGDTARAKVAVYNAATDERIAVLDWTFVKEADGWKIQSAPLP